MTTVQIHDHDLEEIFEWARNALREAKKSFDYSKRQIILLTAHRVEETGIEKSKICNTVVAGLHGIVNDSYVRKTLRNPEYKDQKTRNNILKRYPLERDILWGQLNIKIEIGLLDTLDEIVKTARIHGARRYYTRTDFVKAAIIRLVEEYERESEVKSTRRAVRRF